jgi:hypothetical protein
MADYKVNPPAIFDNYRLCFPTILELAQDAANSADDRGQAFQWCFKTYFAVAEQRDNALNEITSLADTVIEQWADAEWSEDFAAAIAKNHGLVGFDSRPALAYLEDTTTLAVRKAEAAYQRVLAVKHEDANILGEEVKYFSDNYPEDSRIEAVQKFVGDFAKIQVGAKAPDFTGNTVDGKEISLSDYRGKITYLVFWGFW